MDPNTVYVLESRFISMDGATQIPISEFEASEMAQLKSLCLVRPGSVNSKTAYWPNTSSR